MKIKKMKKRLPIAALIALAPILALTSMTASAVDLTVRFTGSFVQGTCSFTVNDVDLGTYEATTFTGSTQTPWTSVTINRGSCTPDISTIHMTFSGTADSNNPAYFAVASSSGNVTGVGIETSNMNNQYITPNTTVLDWPISIGPSYSLQAHLVQTRPSVTAGTIKTPITIQFTYN